jgi:methylsterol monooxygenase
VVYFGRCIPWIIIDAIPYFKKWKLQPVRPFVISFFSRLSPIVQNKVPTAKAQWECTKYVLFTHFTVELPQIWLFHPLAEHLGLKTYHVPFPSWRTMLPQILCFFVLEDIWHYFAHKALHYGPMYKYILKLHHKHSAPFGLAAEVAHPLKIIILGTGTIGGPLLYGDLTANMHFVTVYLWVTLRLFQAVDAHSGYGSFPYLFSPVMCLTRFDRLPLVTPQVHPFLGRSRPPRFPPHGLRQRTSLLMLPPLPYLTTSQNYATSFRWMDYIFGTDTKYRAYKQRVAQANERERQALEQKIFEETEKEGLRAAEETEMEGDVWTLSGKGKIVKTE